LALLLKAIERILFAFGMQERIDVLSTGPSDIDVLDATFKTAALDARARGHISASDLEGLRGSHCGCECRTDCERGARRRRRLHEFAASHANAV
jgi:hypothetical protein